MAGRPKKKPEYNPELQFNNFLQELRDAYEYTVNYPYYSNFKPPFPAARF